MVGGYRSSLSSSSFANLSSVSAKDETGGGGIGKDLLV